MKKLRPEQTAGRLLLRKGMTLAVAESCTGGLICDRLTDVSGSSRYVSAGITAYSDRAKQRLLGVSERLIKRRGAVSSQVAMAMAQGIRKATRSDIGLAVTGVAGPGGGSKKKPVGLVYISVARRARSHTLRYLFSGRRRTIKIKSVRAAINLLVQELSP